MYKKDFDEPTIFDTGNKFIVVATDMPVINVFRGRWTAQEFFEKTKFTYFKKRTLCEGDIIRVIANEFRYMNGNVVYCINKDYTYSINWAHWHRYKWIAGPDNYNCLWREVNEI